MTITTMTRGNVLVLVIAKIHNNIRNINVLNIQVYSLPDNSGGLINKYGMHWDIIPDIINLEI